MEIPDPKKITTHLFVTTGLDRQKVEDDARKRAGQGENVLVHYHSGREQCLYLKPEDPDIVANHQAFLPEPGSKELSRIDNDS